MHPANLTLPFTSLTLTPLKPHSPPSLCTLPLPPSLPQAHKLDGAAFDQGALFAVAMLLSEDSPSTKPACRELCSDERGVGS